MKQKGGDAALLQAVEGLRGTFSAGGDPSKTGAAALALCKAIGGRAGAWLATAIAGQEVRDRGGSVMYVQAEELRSLVEDVPRPLFDPMGLAVWGFWVREGESKLWARKALVEELKQLAEATDDGDHRAELQEVLEAIEERPAKIPVLLTTDEGTQMRFFGRDNFESAGIEVV